MRFYSQFITESQAMPLVKLNETNLKCRSCGCIWLAPKEICSKKAETPERLASCQVVPRDKAFREHTYGFTQRSF